MPDVEGLRIADAPGQRTEPPAAESLPPEVQALQVLGVGEEAGDEGATDALVEAGLGAVVFFASALRDPAAAARRSAVLQAKAAGGAARSPLLIGADEEGGLVRRLPADPAFPSALALGATADADLAREAGAATAGRLGAAGVNWDLAPVCDLWLADNPGLAGRWFGRQPHLAGRLAAAFAAGLQDGGVLGCAKHFPGHGATAVDTHTRLAALPAGATVMQSREWVPFRDVGRRGIAAAMVGHLVVPEWDAHQPASLLPAAYVALREVVGPRALAVTDSLSMAAVTQAAGSVGAAAVAALRAGADMVLVAHGPAEHRAAAAAIVQALRSGSLPVQRLRSACAAVLETKRLHALARRRPPDPDAAAALLARPSDARLARRIAERAVTELAPGPACPNPAFVAQGPGVPKPLAAAARRRWPGVRWEDGAGRWLSLEGRCHLAVGPPLPQPLPEGRVLLAYDTTGPSLQALLDCGEGMIPAVGRLPV